MFGFKPTIPPTYCPTHGCKLVASSYRFDTRFDPNTGIGWEWEQDIVKCPNQEDNYHWYERNGGTWKVGKKRFIRAEANCP